MQALCLLFFGISPFAERILQTATAVGGACVTLPAAAGGSLAAVRAGRRGRAGRTSPVE